MSQEIDVAAKILWDYNKLTQKLKPADCILVMGCHDKRVASRGAELFKQGLAPLIIISGGIGRDTPKSWGETEAEVFAEIVCQQGVPEDKLMIEKQATNCAENMTFSMELLKSQRLEPKSLILVTKPYMERRALATFKKLYPHKEVHVASPEISYEDYPNKEVSKSLFLNTMVGDTQRILLYPKRGFTVYQDMPKEVEAAMDRLIAFGFDKQVIS